MAYASVFDYLHPIRSIRLLKYKSKFTVLYKEYEDLFRKYRIEECKNVSCFSFMVNPDKFLRDKHWYDETIYMPFEDVMMPVPAGYHEILTKQYGDYMIPVQAPSYHGGFWKLDPDNGFECYFPEMKRYAMKMNLLKIIQRIKKLFII